MISHLEALVLSGPLLIVPLGLERLAATSPPVTPRRSVARLRPALLIAAALLLPSAALDAGPLAGLLAAPWLVLGAVLGGVGLADGLRRRFVPLREAVADLALFYVAVGGLWIFAWRADVDLFGFPAPVVILTAAHFNTAGFATTALAVLAARFVATSSTAQAGQRRLVDGIAVAAAGGFGITAVGIGAAVRNLEVLGAWTLVVAVLALAAVQVSVVVPRAASRTGRALLTTSSVSAAVTMVLGGLYAWGRLTGDVIVGIEAMGWSHAPLNVVGFVLPALLAWRLIAAPQSA